MAEFDAYSQTFSRGASPFVRWTLSPVLILVGVVIAFQIDNTLKEGRIAGTVFCVLFCLVCFCGLLALWGVPYVGRIVTASIAISYIGYMFSEFFIDFDGDWGGGAQRSDTTPINAILGFIVFGLPCLIYTILGRFSFKPEEEIFEEDYFYEGDDEPEDETNVEQADGGNQIQR